MIVRRLAVIQIAVFTLMLGLRLPAQPGPALPARSDSLKFAVIGDSGTGDTPQYDVGARMKEARTAFPFEMVIMLGDNLYGRQQPEDFVTKFERPYAPLLQAGVLFYASLGNHDNQSNRSYPGFHMGGERYYTYSKKNAQFFALDSNQLDPRQLTWLDNALKQAPGDWKICYFHHPLYSDGGRHGSDVELRVTLEPLLVKHGVNVVFSGHDHIYERIKPQKGIAYFVNGSSGELRKGDVHPSALTAAYFDQEQAFSLVEIAGDDMFFEARSRTGRTVDAGTIHRLPAGTQAVAP
jgi:3',5'-cyclic AMP phosphodiesterase CpdA